jgi:FtsP/CotA-like multicopper oxidase with cupredoxin domain
VAAQTPPARRRRALAAGVLLLAAALPLGAATVALSQGYGEPPKVHIVLNVQEKEYKILGTPYKAWAFGRPGQEASVPGPIIRLTQGTELTIELVNGHYEPHSFHTHFQHYPISSDGSSHTLPAGGVPHQADDPLGGIGAATLVRNEVNQDLERVGVDDLLGEDVVGPLQLGSNPLGPYFPREDHDVAQPGERYFYNLVANEVGTFVYHCHVFPVEEHIAHGLFGVIIVYPKGWTWTDIPFVQPGTGNTDALVTAPDGTVYYEDVVVLSELDLTGVTDKALVPTTEATGKIQLVNFRTWADPYYVGPVKDGTLMRVVVANMGVTMHSWHVHAHNFDVLDKFDPAKRTVFRSDALALAPGQSFETVLTARQPGFWFVHDHMTAKAYGGMIAWLQVDE